MDVIITFIMTVAMFVGLMLAFRKPLLWYFRINEFLDKQDKIIEMMQEKIKDGGKKK